MSGNGRVRPCSCPAALGCRGAHHLARKPKALGHNARLMPAKYVRPYSKGRKNDFSDAEAIAEAVQRSAMNFVATKTTEQLRRAGMAHFLLATNDSYGLLFAVTRRNLYVLRGATRRDRWHDKRFRTWFRRARTSVYKIPRNIK